MTVKNLALPVFLILVASSCATDEQDSDANIVFRAVDLSTDPVSDVCYTLTASNSDGILWRRENACTSEFGSGLGGSLAYVGSCDASNPTTTIDLEIESVEIDDILLEEDRFVNPCPQGEGTCQVVAECVSNADVPAQFPVTILRRGDDGFVDAAVDFDSITCSAKLDCLDEFLEDGDGERRESVVVAVSCEAASCVDLHMYLNPIRLICDGQEILVDPAGDDGRISLTEEQQGVLFQAARYGGHDELNARQFVNVALGIDLESASNCRIEASATASTTAFSETAGGYSMPASSIYPWIQWDVDVSDGSGNFTCAQHALDAPNSGVTTEYTAIGGPQQFFASVSSLQSSCNRVPTFGDAIGYSVGIPAGAMPGEPLAGDFNNDGHIDLLTVGWGEFMFFMRNNGVGAFFAGAAAGQLATDIYGLRAADLNLDGNLDVVAASNAHSALVVAHGNGDGSFMAPQTISMGLSARSLEVADLNNDGIADLIGGSSGDPIVVFMGQPGGTFGAGTTYSDGGNNRHEMTSADFNGDGNLDLAVGNRDSNDISIFMGDGTGALLPTTRLVGATGFSLATGDFNGDGYPDLASTRNTSNNHSVVVFIGLGDGTFGAGEAFNVGDESPNAAAAVWDVVAADYNGDGLLDLAITNEGLHNISVLLGDGQGAFSAPMNYPNPSNSGAYYRPRQLATADFNADGLPDLAASVYQYRTIGVMLSANTP